MPRNVFQILDELIHSVEELRSALSPLAVLMSGVAAPAVKASGQPELPARKAVRSRRKAAKPAAIKTPNAPKAPKTPGAPKVAKVAKRKVTSAPKGQSKKSEKSPARQLQGQYLGAMRHLNAEQKAQIRQIKEEKGLEAAVRAARALSS